MIEHLKCYVKPVSISEENFEEPHENSTKSIPLEECNKEEANLSQATDITNRLSAVTTLAPHRVYPYSFAVLM